MKAYAIGRGRKKTVAGKIRDCLSAIRYWEKNPAAGLSEEAIAYNRAVFVKAIKAHLAYAEAEGEEIPEELLAKAKAVVEAE